MAIDYDHSKNGHSLEGPQLALPIIFPREVPGSLLDVGCGEGTWVKSAIEFGIPDVSGIDGVAIPREQLLFDPNNFKIRDLTAPVDLGRRFDALLCLEVAEHLEESHALILIETLVRHSDKIVFSAASPGQPGQHHVNCQWPDYWQRLFNRCGYVCEDSVRWQIWDNSAIEPWYRQNMFIAEHAPSNAGREPRIKSVIHPEIWKTGTLCSEMFRDHIRVIERGRMPLRWYSLLFARTISAKLRRRLS